MHVADTHLLWLHETIARLTAELKAAVAERDALIAADFAYSARDVERIVASVEAERDAARADAIAQCIAIVLDETAEGQPRDAILERLHALAQHDAEVAKR